MAMIFRKNVSGSWCATRLPLCEADRFGGIGSQLIEFVAQGRRRAALLVRDGVAAFVNGEQVIGGLRVLANQDEIYSPPERFWFSTEERAQIERLENPEGRAVRCALCRDEIAVGEEFVKCPRCARRFHQSSGPGADTRRCFTYKETCVCDHPTTLSGEFAWTPDNED
jgi:hypothetical protein